MIGSQENFHPPEAVVPISDGNSNEPEPSNNPENTPNVQTNSLRFVLDVQPVQKNIYMSDEFSQTTPGRKNGRLTQVQGYKDNPSSTTPVKPELYVNINY